MRGAEYSQRARDSLENALMAEFTVAFESDVPEDRMVEWMKERTPAAAENAVSALADSLLEECDVVAAGHMEQLAESVEGIHEFWGHALDMFWLVADQCLELGQWFNEQENCKAEADQDELFLALRNTTTRACRTAMEVHYLLCAGFGDAAQSRARTLYELAVVASVIDSSPDPHCTASRFLEHSDWESQQEYRSWAEVFELSEEEAAAARGIDASVENLLAKYGKAYASPWGWAAHLVTGKPTLRALERLTDLADGRPLYRAICHSVHAGSTGAQRVVEWSPEGYYLAYGPVDRLPIDAAIVAMFALTDVVRHLIRSRRDSRETQEENTWFAAIELLLTRAAEEFASRCDQLDAAIDAAHLKASADG